MNIKKTVDTQKAFFRTGTTLEYAYRMKALKALKDAIKLNEQAIIDALHHDLNKSPFEAYSSEIGILLEEIRFIMKHLKTWIKPKKVKTPLTHIGSKSYMHPSPYGVSLIIAPWNYPFQLAIAPLIGAIAAGNCAVVKPSELTLKTSEVIQRIIEEIFPDSYITVLQGDAEVSKQLLQQKFDYIFFTGSVSVGKIIMEAAAKQLTPITLELGGKSPCIIHEDAHLKLAAKRVAWGKFVNAGQTCIAPDYVYVHHTIKNAFLQELENAIVHLYKDALETDRFTKIVSKRHFNRLVAFLEDGNKKLGGEHDEQQRIIEPTILTDINWNHPIMHEEIFGPILPILEYNDLEEVHQGIEHSPNPLALYLFTENSHVEKDILERVSFGGGCVNDTIYHFASPYLPFGGIGSSGTGSYHGKASFETFSHKKSILKQTTSFDIPFRYPNTKHGLKLLKRFLK
ncbi:aldehyde dehydrogenase [Radiobacillus kanasensis]|uniref:aldehyde dehydrogenase n=1 Tax=Radiobacillus kanasensis TaxID=2844358 RepID=UPI001E65BED8|nr:aldehyde dehydrogenase [Radiobacillus kanasensis]UFT99986.1 aldehyde dehydrogenase [Radiobacillus kanasensis]